MFRKSSRTDEVGDVHNSYHFTLFDMKNIKEIVEADNFPGVCIIAFLVIVGMVGSFCTYTSHVQNMYELETKRLNPAPISSVQK
jgi:hypothetical protein